MTLTLVLEYFNVIFSGLFAVEMLLKVLADGPCAYLRVGFNVFDGLIVILR
jgi:Ion transport protein